MCASPGVLTDGRFVAHVRNCLAAGFPGVFESLWRIAGRGAGKRILAFSERILHHIGPDKRFQHEKRVVMTNKLTLGVNIDHVATLRQARGTFYPSVLEAARICEDAGADGITIHLREDRRHIQDADVFELRKSLTTRMNLEMANTPGIVAVALEVAPDEVCLVPERREELTTEGGLDVAGQLAELRKTTRSLTDAGVSVSMFVDPDRHQLEACAKLGAPYVELHTGAFCDAEGQAAEEELKRLLEGARIARDLGLNVNAGHGINMDNIARILEMPFLDTLNIGHSIVARAVFVGLADAVREMIEAMAAYEGGKPS